MRRQRFFLGRIENPTWLDFIRRVGGAAVVIGVVILAAREFFPSHVGIAIIFASLGLIAVAVVQDWRQQKARRARKKG